MGRRPRVALDALRPSVEAKARVSQERQTHYRAGQTHLRTLALGEDVFVKNFTPGSFQPAWLAGVVEAIQGPLSYRVQLTDNRIVRRHIDHVRA